jgi:hypothetical protein
MVSSIQIVGPEWQTSRYSQTSRVNAFPADSKIRQRRKPDTRSVIQTSKFAEQSQTSRTTEVLGKKRVKQGEIATTEEAVKVGVSPPKIELRPKAEGLVSYMFVS